MLLKQKHLGWLPFLGSHLVHVVEAGLLRSSAREEGIPRFIKAKIRRYSICAGLEALIGVVISGIALFDPSACYLYLVSDLSNLVVSF